MYVERTSTLGENLSRRAGKNRGFAQGAAQPDEGCAGDGYALLGRLRFAKAAGADDAEDEV